MKAGFNIEDLIGIFIFIVIVFGNIIKKKLEKGQADAPGETPENEIAEAIREEIRRKRQEREGGVTESASVTPPVLPDGSSFSDQPESSSVFVSRSDRYEQQKKEIEKTLARVQELNRQMGSDASRGRGAVQFNWNNASSDGYSPLSNDTARLLKSSSGLRQAMLLHEILGPPVALRGNHPVSALDS